MRCLIIFLLTVVICHTVFAQQDFLSQQKKYARVRTAFAEKEEILTENLRKNRLATDSIHLLMAVFKAEKELEVYAKRSDETVYGRIAMYAICASSGNLGPKREKGDKQVPEGFYTIDRFNPASNFYLSLGINYPNSSDRKKSNAADPGGDIFIHGSCVSIGCLPVSDDKIKEIYLYALFARNNGQKAIPVYLFPFRMTDANFSAYKQRYAGRPELVDFWTHLKSGYDRFVTEKKALKVSVDASGNYLF